jgi:hypothetical protein
LWILSPSCLDERGVRAVVTIREAGMRGRGCLGKRELCADEQGGCGREVVWSWRPGAGAKSAMMRFARSADDGGKTAGPRGDHV